MKHFQETKSPILVKNLLIPESESNDWLLNHQSYVSQCSTADVPFSCVEDVKPENSQSTSQQASDVTLQELIKMAPNQKVNVRATLSMGTKEPKKIETKTGQTLTVKEDCILEDGSTTMEIHIWEPLFDKLTDKKAYHFKNLTLRYYAGIKFLSTNKNTIYTEDSSTLQNLVGPEMLTNPDREIMASEVKFISNLNLFLACQVCKKRVGDESGESVRCQNCKVRQRVKNCKREGSVKICIQDGDVELWLTVFTNELVELLKKTTQTLESTEDDIEDALMGLADVKIKYNCKRNIVQEISSQ